LGAIRTKPSANQVVTTAMSYETTSVDANAAARQRYRAR
jgi:hypothetical protein